MALLHWRESLALGVRVIDDDHRRLIDSINRLSVIIALGAEPAAVAAILDELSEHTRGHFRREEMLMRLAGYPGYAAHCALHRMLAQRCEDLRSSCRSGAGGARVHRLCDAFAEGLLVHMVEEDSKIKPFVMKLDEANAA